MFRINSVVFFKKQKVNFSSSAGIQAQSSAEPSFPSPTRGSGTSEERMGQDKEEEQDKRKLFIPLVFLSANEVL